MKAGDLVKLGTHMVGNAGSLALSGAIIWDNATNIGNYLAGNEYEGNVWDSVTAIGFALIGTVLGAKGLEDSGKAFNALKNKPVGIGGKTTPRLEYNLQFFAESPKRGKSSVLDNANYAQKTYGNRFSEKGIQKYTELAGEPVNTIDDLVSAINTGKINVSDLPVEYIVRDGNTLILNTRTSQALTQAGIPRSQWNAINRTGNTVFEDMLDGQLSRNKLTSEGIATVRPSGGKK